MPASEPDKTSRTDDERIAQVQILPPPEDLLRFFPIEGSAVESLVSDCRNTIRRILRGEDERLLVVIGPCSIHDPRAALDYARRLAGQRERFRDTLEVVMRVYFEKPRTTVGWKGLINDPYLDESCRINEGLRIARSLLIDIARLGVPAGSELLDTLSPQYLADLVAWGAIGARTTESQVHRELASGTSAPIGFKNGTDGNVRVAIDAMLSARSAHNFLGIHKNGHVAMLRTRGNADCHLILRGGRAPNHDRASVEAACAALLESGCRPSLMIDCSHANSGKQAERQAQVAEDVAMQLAAGSRHILGVMIESHLVGGRQAFTPGTDDPASLVYGQSITDGCLGWDDSVALLERLDRAVRERRRG
ncbi:MAG: 3-deoxy-7-phosphoheptulonate synthase [Burkholderiaceae bacterium]|nr:3-deoxy-7-phosphoheptulonate synthase [Burkholderiaceae bacterium]